MWDRNPPIPSLSCSGYFGCDLGRHGAEVEGHVVLQEPGPCLPGPQCITGALAGRAQHLRMKAPCSPRIWGCALSSFLLVPQELLCWRETCLPRPLALTLASLLSCSLLEESYVMKDPFTPDKDRFLILGSRCTLCSRLVCVGPECSLFYSKRFCLPCVQEHIDAFPQEIRQDLEKRKVPSKRHSSQPGSRT
ncbi:cysteine-rich DPF motif domain-containing protein 1 isoform X2 [Manis pentadactyla]|uniref:cysteine-rich DPF motif domain-containing protein 1 isoform X2 n=1 Tax=Manis pentadactyla TaxID=143292 RepID=UPI00255CC054|nr:cysteine-rich DPF motif domain-containing protein 1 isoform X2 [Manis pentadactyla]